LPTHVDGPLYKTIFNFSLSYFKLAGLLAVAAIARKKAILHLHIATGGSFMRKAILILSFSWFTDKTILHFHSGETVTFLRKVCGFPGGKLLIRILFALTDNFIIVSETLNKEVQLFLSEQQVSIKAEKWQVLPNAIALPSPLPSIKKYISKRKLHILTVSRLNKVKNLTLLPEIAVFLKATQVDFHMTIVGDGPERAALEKAIFSHNVGKHITLVGNIPHEKIAEYYKDADLFLLPSLYESFGIVVLEAYAYGIPAITSNVGGLNDIVLEGETGYKCNPTQALEFTQRIKELFSDSTQFNRMKVNAQKCVQRFGYPNHLEQLKYLYEK
jgi:glycosyltransferase involved in cell wall biosynthesis